jgi:hypothetical protein
VNIPFPIQGQSEDFALTDQPPNTTVSSQSCRALDPKSGRIRGGPRSGTTRYPDDPLGAGVKVSHVATVTYDAPNQTYASLGNSLTTEWSAANPVTGDTLGIQCGSQSDVYIIDGPTGIAKLNADGTFLWKIALAPDDTSHTVRALFVDAGTPGNAGTDLVLAGVSAGGRSTNAKIWAYIQLDDNKTQKLWEMQPGGYTEAIRVYQDKLYLLVNFPEQNRAAVIVYDEYLAPNPTEVNRWGVPYPAHDLDVSPKNGFIYTASDAAVPNASFNRDLNPQCPKATLDYIDWTPYDLANFQQRLWSWYDATEDGTVSVDPRNLAVPGAATVVTAPPGDSLDGGDVRVWLDKSGKGRHWYQTTDLPIGAGNAALRGAIYRTKGIAGKPSLHFDGVTCGLKSEAPGSVDKAFRSEQLTALPGYVGAQFVCCMAVRISQDNTTRALLGWGNAGVNWNTGGRFIAINSAVTNSATPTVRPGHIYAHEPGGSTTGSDAGASTPNAGAPGGASVNDLPLGFGLPDSGLAIITWICDGRQQDVFGTATRSTFRVNGNPCDRWQSGVYNTLAATTLGYIADNTASAVLKGAVFEIGEMIVLSDWYDSNDAIQRLINTSGTDTSIKYPDSAWFTAGDSELERLEGYLAHKWGMAHELQGGKFGKLHFGGQPATNDTVTIGSTVYRFRDVNNVLGAGVQALTQQNDITIGADFGASALNFYRAINTQGTSGTDYHFTTSYNPDVRANEPTERADASWDVIIRPRNTFAAAITLSETGVNLDWTHATTQDAASGSSTDWYPHPFFVDRTTNTPGGPPRTAGATTISNYWRLRSTYPILAAWDPANGRCRDVLTSNYDGLGSGIGGVGYGVRVASTGEVFSCGPRQAVVSALPAIVADATDVRKFTWSNSAFGSLTPSASNDVWAWGSGSTPASPGALGYAYPRMAVDKFDNLYLPYFNTTGGIDASLIAFTKASTGAILYNPVVIFTYSGLVDHNEAYAVAVDPRYPTFQTGNLLNRAEFLLLATRIESAATSRSSAWKLRALSTSVTGSTLRAVKAIGICNFGLFTFTSTTKTLVDGAALDTSAGFIDSMQMFGKRYFTDGRQYKKYDPVLNTVTAWTSSGPGVIPPRCKLISTWRQRPVLARSADNPNQFYLGKQGETDNFDMLPYTITAIQAVTGSDSSAGMPADIINAWISYNDDLAFIGGDHSIVRLTGDPSPGGGGTIHLVSDSVGIAFGRAWCKDPKGVIYFFGSRGGVYRLDPSGIPTPLSSSENPYRNKIERRLQSIDLTLYFIRMEWNDVDKGFHVIVCPYGAGGTIVEHYFWEEIGGWWPDKWLTSAIQPTSICVMDGDLAADRVVLLGCEDGYVRKWDRNAVGDDTIPGASVGQKYIDSFVRIGPLAGSSVDMEHMFTRLWAVFANDQGAPWVKLYATDRPDVVGDPVWQGKMQPGRNPWINVRVRASYVYLDLQLSDPRQRWSFESMGFASVEPFGIARSVTV